MRLHHCDAVTRIEVIDSLTGRVYTAGSYQTEVQLQDMGLTLKIFIDKMPYSQVFSGTDSTVKRNAK